VLKPALGDKLIMIAVALVALGLWLANVYFLPGHTQNYITVHVNNKLVAEVSFSPDDHRIIDIPLENGHIAQIEIKDGKVRVLPMERDVCPLGICSATGWIEKSYETIVCVPNRMVVGFSEYSHQDGEDMDMITF